MKEILNKIKDRKILTEDELDKLVEYLLLEGSKLYQEHVLKLKGYTPKQLESIQERISTLSDVMLHIFNYYSGHTSAYDQMELLQMRGRLYFIEGFIDGLQTARKEN
jgi:hypothetical protein